MNTAHTGHQDRTPGVSTKADRQARYAFIFFVSVCGLALVVFALMPFIG